MTSLWDVHGENLDHGYVNLRDGDYEAGMRDQLTAMWAMYEPYADPDFRHGFARDPDARFWEMYLGGALLEAGKSLLPTVDRLHEGGQPDICVLDEGRRIWIEAVAPDGGQEGPDQVKGPVPINEGGGFAPMPVRQAQLRVTSALWTKTQAVAAYVGEGVIRPEDVRLIAIGVGKFGLYASDNPPLILSAVFPIGDEFLTIDAETAEVIGQGVHPSFEISRHGGGVVPRTAFQDEQFAHISSVIWSRVSIGNMHRPSRPLTLVHNPLAAVAMPQSWGVWDREFVTTSGDEQWVATDILAGNAA